MPAHAMLEVALARHLPDDNEDDTSLAVQSI